MSPLLSPLPNTNIVAYHLLQVRHLQASSIFDMEIMIPASASLCQLFHPLHQLRDVFQACGPIFNTGESNGGIIFPSRSAQECCRLPTHHFPHILPSPPARRLSLHNHRTDVIVALKPAIVTYESPTLYSQISHLHSTARSFSDIVWLAQANTQPTMAKSSDVYTVPSIPPLDFLLQDHIFSTRPTH
ncbi:uncharacterized protein ARMOST_13998 [Armillaria ostoyae]|uniref:Uncharacterized protein n=1 Tax=Armillaria ostoyae TaxID=47428 RepID=A0A284RPE8_ARMOS|nr:uncharacterized protein ARMOST_13998 [Armillaria ostoyae]